MSKVFFTGTYDGIEHKVTVTDNNITKELDPRFDLRNHSPDGHNWGYMGSGPSQLSLAILAYLYGDEFATEHYMNFKGSVIGLLPFQKNFTLTKEDIDKWYENISKRPINVRSTA